MEQENRDKDKMIDALKDKMRQMALHFAENEESRSLNNSFEK